MATLERESFDWIVSHINVPISIRLQEQGGDHGYWARNISDRCVDYTDWRFCCSRQQHDGWILICRECGKSGNRINRKVNENFL